MSKKQINETQQMRAIPKKALQQGVSRRAGIKNDKRRFYLMWLIITLCFCLLLGKAMLIQIFWQNDYEERANSAIERTRIIEPSRGVIYDRNNIPLALSTPMKTLSFNAREYTFAKLQWEKSKKKLLKTINFLTPKEQQQRRANIAEKDARFDIAALAEAVGYDEDAIREKFKEKAIPKDSKIKEPIPISQYLMLKRRIPPEVANIVLQKRFAGVHATTEYKRYYPQPQPNAHLLGFMVRKVEHKKKMVRGKEVKLSREFYTGDRGLEKRFEDRLAGKPGKIRLVKGADGFGVVDDKLLKPEVAGEHVYSSIDSRLQYILYRELEKAGRLHAARSASGIVLDARTGEVLAMTNWPTFNGNRLLKKSVANMHNRVVAEAFEPGSVVKPLTVIAGLESGKFHKNSVIHTGGRIKVGGKVFTDHGAPMDVSMQNLIKYSSNVASIRVGLALPRDGIANMFQKLGLGKKTALNLPLEKQGNAKPPTKHQKQRRANMTFGYSVETTLAQLAQAYSVIAAKGVLRPLTLERQDKIPAGEQVITPETADSVLNMMKSVVYGNGGTGHRARVKGYTVAGKTGTARKLKPDYKGYYEDRYRALFIGTAPVSNPRFVVAIVVEDPVGDYTGGKVAAPVFSKVMGESLRLYNVPMDKKLK